MIAKIDTSFVARFVPGEINEKIMEIERKNIGKYRKRPISVD